MFGGVGYCGKESLVLRVFLRSFNLLFFWILDFGKRFYLKNSFIDFFFLILNYVVLDGFLGGDFSVRKLGWLCFG